VFVEDVLRVPSPLALPNQENFAKKIWYGWIETNPIPGCRKGKAVLKAFILAATCPFWEKRQFLVTFCVRIYQFTWFLIRDSDYIMQPGNISVHNLEVSLSYKVILCLAIMIIGVFQEIKRNLSLANDFCFGCFVLEVLSLSPPQLLLLIRQSWNVSI